MSQMECVAGVLKEAGPVVIALSGGTDSLTLLAIAAAANVTTAAVTVRSGLNPPGEIRRAVEFARSLGVCHAVVDLDAAAIPAVAGNRAERCYFCRKAMMRALNAWAQENGFAGIADGSHIGDDPQDRPGMAAAAEEGVISPFIQCGLDREDIISLAPSLGVPVLPSSSCLATRIVPGTPVTRELAALVGRAETIVAIVVKGRIRVRTDGRHATVEVPAGNRSAVSALLPALFDLGFEVVEIREME